jgi:hypothetical protein
LHVIYQVGNKTIHFASTLSRKSDEIYETQDLIIIIRMEADRAKTQAGRDNEKKTNPFN